MGGPARPPRDDAVDVPRPIEAADHERRARLRGHRRIGDRLRQPPHLVCLTAPAAATATIDACTPGPVPPKT